jgi:hypothetical protein
MLDYHCWRYRVKLARFHYLFEFVRKRKIIFRVSQISSSLAPRLVTTLSFDGIGYLLGDHAFSQQEAGVHSSCSELNADRRFSSFSFDAPGSHDQYLRVPQRAAARRQLG